MTQTLSFNDLQLRKLWEPHEKEIAEHHAWKNKVASILSCIKTPWELVLEEDKVYKTALGCGRLYIQIQFQDTDNTDPTNTNYKAHCRKWYLSPHMTTQEIVRTAYLAYMQAVRHEADEKFLYKDVAIFNPHRDPDALVSVAQIVQHRSGEK